MLGADPSGHNGLSSLVVGRGSGAHRWQQRHGSKCPVVVPWNMSLGGTIVAIRGRGARMGGGLGLGLGSHFLSPITRIRQRVIFNLRCFVVRVHFAGFE